jgi:signal transduction histidine kinase
MTRPPTLDEIFAVMAEVSVGEMSARVPVPEAPSLDDPPTRVALGLNVLLDDLSFRVERAQRLANRLGVLAEATRDFFAETQDQAALLNDVARRLATHVKEVCAVLLVSKDGRELQPAAVHGPEDLLGAARLAFQQPLLLEHHPIVRGVLETGRPFVAARLDLDEIRRLWTPAFHAFAAGTGMHGLLVVPLRVRGTPLGQVLLSRHRPESGPFVAHDVDLASGLSDHAALALDNARSQDEQRRLEEQLRHAQKMEAVGRLAGGVAHDFNNILAVILGYAESLLRELGPGLRMRADVEQIHAAGRRAADLTRQLLAFSRHQVLEPRVVAVNEALAKMGGMLRRLLGEDVELVSAMDPAVGNVRIDPGSLEQVIMNLVVNARDAMPDGGKLTIATTNVVVDDEYARAHVGSSPGPHVAIAVSDTGVGMDRATLARLFEPFFTTKEHGKGTGLGLSTVFGIVRQCGGSIAVDSEPGRGSTFRVYLPLVNAEADPRRSAPPQAPPRGDETILLVEDSDQVRRVVGDILVEHGYRVLEARLASEALRIASDYAGDIHLLVTDVVMPQMSGPELAERFVLARRETRVVFMSGYADDSAMRRGAAGPGVAYLQKPFTTVALTLKVREVLDQR